MKSKFTLIALFLMGGLLFNSSCKKTEEAIVDKIAENIDVLIDGDKWHTETITTVKNGNNYIITALKGTNESLIFTLTDLAVGEYSLKPGSGNSAVFTNGNDPAKNIYSAGGGSVKITAIIEDGKEFEGTFEFTAFNANLDSKMFTSGTMINIKNP
jgi:hypothetical protein